MAPLLFERVVTVPEQLVGAVLDDRDPEATEVRRRRVRIKAKQELEHRLCLFMHDFVSSRHSFWFCLATWHRSFLIFCNILPIIRSSLCVHGTIVVQKDWIAAFEAALPVTKRQEVRSAIEGMVHEARKGQQKRSKADLGC